MLVTVLDDYAMYQINEMQLIARLINNDGRTCKAWQFGNCLSQHGN